MTRNTCILRHLSPAIAVFAITLLLPPATPAQDQPWQNDPNGPKLSRGTGTQFGTFEFQTLDSISFLNGGVNLHVPIGQAYPAGGSLSYQLVAYFNSHWTEQRMRRDCIPPPAECVDYAASVPYAFSNAGRGWLVHLGRLFEPDDWDQWRRASINYRDSHPVFHSDWIYVEPDGTERHFSNSLHGEPSAQGTTFYTRDGSYDRFQLIAAAAGSAVCNSNLGVQQCAELEEANGEIRRFEKRAGWPDAQYNRDVWRLRQIRDRFGNAITIDYYTNHWSITDRYGRIQIVWWESDPWFGGRVDKVTLTGFSAATVNYDFTYVNVHFLRWNDQHILNLEGDYGRLQSISRPDDKQYGFTYDTTGFGHDITFLTAALPAGGTVEWDFDRAWETPVASQCLNFLTRQIDWGIVRREAKDSSGLVLTQATYHPSLQHSAGVATDYCRDENGVPTRPKAEHVTGEFQKYADGKGRLDLHYFSVFPGGFAGSGSGNSGGWRPEDYGQPFTRDESNADLYLSTRTFDCPFGTLDSSSNPETAAQGCTLMSSNYVLIEQDYSKCVSTWNGDFDSWTLDPTWHCLNTNARVAQNLTVFHDDSGKIMKDISSDNDGFGHYRIVKTTGTIGPDQTRDVRTLYNNGRGTLDFLPNLRTVDTYANETAPDDPTDADDVNLGTPSDPIWDDDGDGMAWNNYAPGDKWVLNSYTQRRVRELVPASASEVASEAEVAAAGPDEGVETDYWETKEEGLDDSSEKVEDKESDGESVVTQAFWRTLNLERTCFTPDGLLRRVRVRKSPGVDGLNDLVRVYAYDAGLPTSVKFYGGDVSQLPAAGATSGCNFAFENSAPKYQLSRVFEFGVLKSSFIPHPTSGYETYVVRNTAIDKNTGLVATSKDPSGNITETYLYDGLGRPTAITRTASTPISDEVFTYCLPGYSGACSDTRYVNQRVTIIETKEGATTFQKTATFYDEVGRVFKTEKLHPEATTPFTEDNDWIRVTRTLGPLGQILFETTPQRSNQFDPSKGSSFTYDVFDRVVTATAPDGRLVTHAYFGARETRTSVPIGTTENANGNVDTTRVTTKLIRDRYGNTLSVTEPTSATTNKVTTSKYDGLNRIIEAKRGSQTRLYSYDGRSFKTSERHPEYGASGNGTVTYSSYDAVGNLGRMADGASVLAYEYDPEGRVTRITDGASPSPNPYIVNTYQYAPGTGKGRLISAERYNYVTAQNSGGVGAFPGGDGLYGPRRVTYSYTYEANGKPDTRAILVHNPNNFLIQSYTQSWDYDALGRTKTINYPRCSIPGCSGSDTARTATLTYSFGSITKIASTVGSPAINDNLGANLTYHLNGQLAAIKHGDATLRKTDFFGMGTARMVRVESINLAAPSNGSDGFLNLGNYAYDGAGNITKINADRFIYDYNSRLAKAYTPGFWGQFQTFAYDQYDNMTASTPDTLAVSTVTNRFVTVGQSVFEYNAAGHLIRTGGTTPGSGYNFHYDDFGKQESMVYSPTGTASPCNLQNTTGSCWLYWYGPDGERIGGATVLSGGGGDYYWTVRDLDGRILRTYKGVNGDPTNRMTEEFVYAGRNLIGGKEIATGVATHYHTDHLGTTRVATNAANGTLIGTRNFSAYGRLGTGSGILDETIAEWAGYEKDPNGATHNLKARQYFNVWGRFFTPDPARDGWNLYAYAYDNPINKIDSTGTLSEPPPPVAVFSEEITVTAPARLVDDLLPPPPMIIVDREGTTRDANLDRFQARAPKSKISKAFWLIGYYSLCSGVNAQRVGEGGICAAGQQQVNEDPALQSGEIAMDLFYAFAPSGRPGYKPAARYGPGTPRSTGGYSAGNALRDMGLVPRNSNVPEWIDSTTVTPPRVIDPATGRH